MTMYRIRKAEHYYRNHVWLHVPRVSTVDKSIEQGTGRESYYSGSSSWVSEVFSLLVPGAGTQASEALCGHLDSGLRAIALIT